MAEGVTRDDLRAAVASGVIDEAQAVKLQTLSDQRMGFRANMVGDDEPFELFKGFAEIFVTVGLGLLMFGFFGLTAIFGDIALIPIVMVALSVALALYFTLRRRMTLPSIALCIAFAIGMALSVAGLLPKGFNVALYTGIIGMFATALYYRGFRLPFAMLVFGIFGLIAVTGVVNIFEPPPPVIANANNTIFDWLGITRYFDLENSPYMAVGTLIFGIIAFIGALWFDTKDPHRVSRYASTAFWLHILAAPALVNTLVMSNYTMGGAGTVLAIAVLIFFTLLAVIIDRRSFLTAGLIYMGLLITNAIAETGTDWAPVLTTLTLGVFVTALGAFWTQARAAIMGALPDFPGKDRLPPYADGLTVSE